MNIEKKFLKFCCASMLVCASYANAQLVNGISVLVNNEPITLYEIHKLSQQQNIDLKEALNILIQKRLEDSQIKKLSISANSFEVSQEVEKIAEKSGMSKRELLNILASKGINEKEYLEDVEKALKNRKLYRRIFKGKSPMPNESEVRAYYENHRANFVKSESFDTTKYTAASPQSLQKKVEFPLGVVDGVTSKQEIISANVLNKKTDYYLNQTPVGKFTPPLREGRTYVMYYINSKSGSTPIGFDEAKRAIATTLAKQNEKMAVDDYFQKLKADADIEIVRKP